MEIFYSMKRAHNCVNYIYICMLIIDANNLLFCNNLLCLTYFYGEVDIFKNVLLPPVNQSFLQQQQQKKLINNANSFLLLFLLIIRLLSRRKVYFNINLISCKQKLHSNSWCKNLQFMRDFLIYAIPRYAQQKVCSLLFSNAKKSLYL